MGILYMIDPLWEKQPGENATRYQAFRDYLFMGSCSKDRSYAVLLRRYRASPENETPPTKRRKTIVDWAVKYEWIRRTEAYDAYQMELREEKFEKARKKIIDVELVDYQRQLDKWIKYYHKLADIDKPDIDDLLKLTKLRDEIAKQGRRALGLPDRFTESKLTGPGKKGEIKIEITDEERSDRLAALLGQRENQSGD